MLGSVIKLLVGFCSMWDLSSSDANQSCRDENWIAFMMMDHVHYLMLLDSQQASARRSACDDFDASDSAQ